MNNEFINRVMIVSSGMVLLIICQILSAPYNLSGTVRGVIKNQGSPYIVEQELIVENGEVLLIEPGVVLLFKNFTGLTCNGKLMVQGTKIDPVIFTSERDTLYNKYYKGALRAAPYDWNGITLTENGAGSTFKNCKIYYSLFGLSSGTDFITLSSCEFSGNGKADLTISGKKIAVSPNVLFNHGISNPGIVAKRDSLQKEEFALKKNYLRFAGIGLFAAGSAIGALELYNYSRARKKFSRLNSANNENLRKLEISKEWEEAKRDVDIHMAGTFAGFGLSALGTVGVVISFGI